MRKKATGMKGNRPKQTKGVEQNREGTAKVREKRHRRKKIAEGQEMMKV